MKERMLQSCLSWLPLAVALAGSLAAVLLAGAIAPIAREQFLAIARR